MPAEATKKTEPPNQPNKTRDTAPSSGNPDVFAALAYDSALLVAKAIEDAGSADPAKIAEAMAKIKGFKGVSGEVTFNEQHNPIKSAVIIEHKDGKQTFKTKVNP